MWCLIIHRRIKAVKRLRRSKLTGSQNYKKLVKNRAARGKRVTEATIQHRKDTPPSHMAED
ncbi:hypothetical protein St703_11160 [Sporolactobacillus terrae]|uniref:Uncharacterized protein n=1 Tax=Sporolactobacillus terrae TaxID=269673 RepID=A0A5K7WUP9_9BACL|nr:hypothetical protein St703_11160 [Sporolactobacillus terrae]